MFIEMSNICEFASITLISDTRGVEHATPCPRRDNSTPTPGRTEPTPRRHRADTSRHTFHRQ